MAVVACWMLWCCLGITVDIVEDLYREIDRERGRGRGRGGDMYILKNKRTKKRRYRGGWNGYVRI